MSTNNGIEVLLVWLLWTEITVVIFSRMSMNFETYVINGLERISIPSDVSTSLRRNMLGLYKPNQWYAKVAWAAVRQLASLSRCGLITHCSVDPSARLEQFDWRGWLQEICHRLNMTKLLPAFYFPPQLERKKCSILLFSSAGEPVAYAKAAWGMVEKAQLIQERKAAELYQKFLFRTFRVPTLLFADSYEGRPYNVFTVLPIKSLSVPKTWSSLQQNAWEELNANTQHHRLLREVHWWERVQHLSPQWKSFAERMTVQHTVPVQFSWVHGDFAIWNMAIHHNELYIFDWENFEDEAPILVDPLYFLFSKEFFLKKHINSARLVPTLLSTLGGLGGAWDTVDLQLALLYLKIVNQDRRLTGALDELFVILSEST
jgi:hypothetical protein